MTSMFFFHEQETEVGDPAAVIQTNDGHLKEVSEDATSGLGGLESNLTTSTQFIASGIIEGDTDVFYAYLIVGIITICGGLAFFMIFIATPPRNVIKTKEERKKEVENDEDTKPDKLAFKIPFLIGVFIFFVSYCMVEGNYGNFLLAYAVEGLGWSKSMGTAVTAVFWASFTIGRASGIITVKLVRPQVLLGVDCFLSVISLLPLLLFAHVHQSVLWISSVALGLTMSTIFATAITWTERYVNVSGGVGTIFLTAGATGEIVGPLILSALYKQYGIEGFVYIMFSATAITLVFYIILQAAACKKGERYIKPSSTENNTQNNRPRSVCDGSTVGENGEENDDDEEEANEREIEIELENMLKRHQERDGVGEDVVAV